MLIRILLILFFANSWVAYSQMIVTGTVRDAKTARALAFVNIGISNKNTGTTSLDNGNFSLKIPDGHFQDTLSFSLVGYQRLDVPVSQLTRGETLQIELNEKSIELGEVRVVGSKPVAKKYGIRRHGGLLRFTDGMFSQEDIFEIGQLIKLRGATAAITSVHLYISNDTEDSASFRINFYRYNGDKPSGRIIEKSILQKHAVKKGWLKFDIAAYGIVIQEDFVVTIECMPNPGKSGEPLAYEVKLGGLSKSFYRRNSLGQWNTPPHHYCLFVTALVEKEIPDEPEDQEMSATFKMYSEVVKDTFSVFVRLPADYGRVPGQRYPVVYHLDANAYADHIGASVQKHSRKKSYGEPLVVGIGYRDAYVMDSLRNRDYLFPQALAQDSFPVSGGGEKFYDFIKDELIPRIESQYRTDTVNRTLMGHSFGGYFGLYALLRGLKQGFVFHNYVVASPSLYYHHHYLMKAFMSVQPIEEKPLKLFMTTGGAEIEEDPDSNFHVLESILKKHRFIDLQTRIYRNLDHMGTAVPTFEDGLKFVGRKAKVK